MNKRLSAFVAALEGGETFCLTLCDGGDCAAGETCREDAEGVARCVPDNGYCSEGPVDADVGPGTADTNLGADVGTVAGTEPSSGCDCQTGQGGGAPRIPGDWAFVVVVLVALALRRWERATAEAASPARRTGR